MRRLNSVDEVFELLESGGGEAYFGEPVTVLEHSLRAAWFVQRDGGDDALIAAALLHDLGHLLHSEGEDAATRGLDTHHEDLGVDALAGHLPPPSSTPFACMWRPSATCVSPSRITWPHCRLRPWRASICRAAR